MAENEIVQEKREREIAEEGVYLASIEEPQTGGKTSCLLDPGRGRRLQRDGIMREGEGRKERERDIMSE